MRYEPNDPAYFALAMANYFADSCDYTIDKFRIAAALHNYCAVIDGITFSFVAGIQVCSKNLLVIGVRIDRDGSAAIPAASFRQPAVCYDSRVQPQLTGKYFFTTDQQALTNNYFFGPAHFRIGFLALEPHRQDGNLRIDVVQETIQFSGGLRNEYPQTEMWRHLAIGIIESLARREGYRQLWGINHPKKRFAHLYARLFTNRFGLDDLHAYRLVPASGEIKNDYWVTDV